MKAEEFYNYFLGFIVIISIVLIGLSLFNITLTDDTNFIDETEFKENLIEYMSEFDKAWQQQKAAEEKISRKVFEDLEQENANLKMTVTTFESLISTLDADNEKLSEIIEKNSNRVGGWSLFFLLLLTSGLGAGLVFLNIQLNSNNKGIVND